jgi:preprotein translocase subunit SecE
MWRVTGRSRAALLSGWVLVEVATAFGRSVWLVMANPFQFLQEVRQEANKVTWPTRRETMITTGMVLLMVVLASAFFVAVDQALHFVVALILRLGH